MLYQRRGFGARVATVIVLGAMLLVPVTSAQAAVRDEGGDHGRVGPEVTSWHGWVDAVIQFVAQALQIGTTTDTTTTADETTATDPPPPPPDGGDQGPGIDPLG